MGRLLIRSSVTYRLHNFISRTQKPKITLDQKLHKFAKIIQATLQLISYYSPATLQAPLLLLYSYSTRTLQLHSMLLYKQLYYRSTPTLKPLSSHSLLYHILLNKHLYYCYTPTLHLLSSYSPATLQPPSSYSNVPPTLPLQLLPIPPVTLRLGYLTPLLLNVRVIWKP